MYKITIYLLVFFINFSMATPIFITTSENYKINRGELVNNRIQNIINTDPYQQTLNYLIESKNKVDVYNIGNDASGTHCHKTHAYNCRLIESYPSLQRIKVSENLDAKEHMKRFFKSLKPSVFIRLKSMLKRVMT